MATTKKSTKAKTKTSKTAVRKSASATKKPVSKTAIATRTSKKTVTTKVAKPVPSRKAAVSTASRRKLGLNLLYVLSGLVGAGLAIAAGFLMNNRAYQLFTGLQTRDELASQTSTVFASAIHSMYDLELRWAVVAIMALSALLPLIYLLRKNRYKETVLNDRLHFWRWLEAGVITGLMVEVVALLSGIQDVMTLKVLGGIIVVSSLLRWVAEKQQAEGSASRRSISVLSIVSCLLPGVLIAGYAVATYVYGMVRAPWYVYALYVTLIVGFIAYVTNLGASLKRLQTGTVTQRNYMLIGLMTKVAFAVILILGLKK